LVLLHTDNFASTTTHSITDNNKENKEDTSTTTIPLSIHIRSAPYKQVFSYISATAIRIGDQVLEIRNKGEHYVNGIVQTIGSTESLHGYPVTSSVTKRGRYVYKINLSHIDDQAIGRGGGGATEEIVVREYRNWITVSIYHPTFEHFAGSTGLMGSFPHGKWIGRDGVTVHESIIDYGNDWIVQTEHDGNSLFQSPSPFPDKCDLPSKSSMALRGRKLQETIVSKAEAYEACSHWNIDQMEDCVMDVLIADDVEVAQNGPILVVP
jgi:hypothetical protein